jgi:hypothetical protein
MDPARRATAALVVALLIAAVSRWRADPSRPTALQRVCGTHWVEVEAASDEGTTSTVVCARPGSPGKQPTGPARLLLGLPIELNLASTSTLEALPGIGPGRAAAIVRARCGAAFERLADVARVHGIGAKTVAALQGLAIAGPPTPDCATAPTLPP